jgi:cytochrome c553
MARIFTRIGTAPSDPVILRNPLPSMGLALMLVICMMRMNAPAFAVEEETGQAIYKEECARCHGPSGDGTKKTTRPLVGDKSPAQLLAVIKRTMPDDDPGSCTDDEYRKVAAYIHDAFYSPDAQARLHPQRVALSHLTVGQYRSAVADLIGGFRRSVKLDGRQGLHGEYFNSKDFRNDRRVIDRLDPVVSFDFGLGGPDADPDGDPSEAKFNPEQFCIRWQGSVLAEETGSYEFVVHTDHALRLWVNDPKKALIDAIIKSGQDTEYRAPIYLIAGRPYSIRLEVYKGQQLNDKKKKPPVPSKESVALLWRPPRRPVDELIPSRSLSPVLSPEVAVIQTPFPPDDRSYGWERGTTVSKEWVAATTDAAMDVAEYVAAHLGELAGEGDDPKTRQTKARSFCRSFAERAFGRPLTDAQKQELVDRQFDDSPDLELAVKRAVIRVMISPRFLYPGAATGPGTDIVDTADGPGAPDGYAVASRLALVLWDSLPDPQLLAAAAQGKLSTHEQIAQQAQRMLDDPRARLKIRQFLLAWLRVDQSPDLVKDPKKFPDFDAALAADLRTSLELFLDDVVSSDAADFRQLLLSDDVFLNGRLAKFYGVDLPNSPGAGPAADSGFTKVKLEAGQRSGVLTQPYMLATFAYPRESSPIHRGVFIIRGILGVTLRPPANAAFTPLAAELHPDLTTRERIALQTSSETCAGCHSMINPLGFALENFDAVGRHREMENTKPIDVSGHYETRAGPDVSFAGPRQLATFLAGSDEAHDAFAQQMFQQFVKQPVRAYGLERPQQLREIFARSGYNIRKLLVEIAVIASQDH